MSPLFTLWFVILGSTVFIKPRPFAFFRTASLFSYFNNQKNVASFRFHRRLSKALKRKQNFPPLVLSFRTLLRNTLFSHSYSARKLYTKNFFLYGILNWNYNNEGKYVTFSLSWVRFFLCRCRPPSLINIIVRVGYFLLSEYMSHLCVTLLVLFHVYLCYFLNEVSQLGIT